MLVPTLLPGLDKAGVAKLGKAQGTIFKAKFLMAALLFPSARDLIVAAINRGAPVSPIAGSDLAMLH